MIGNAPAAGDVDIKSTPELRVPAARRLGKPERFGDRLPTVAAAATLVMLLAMTIGTTVAVRTFIRGKSIERLQSAASSATVSADAEITRGLTDLLAVEGLFKATGTVEPVHFNAFAESIMGRGSSVRVLGFVRQVLPEGAAGFNQSMHDRGLVGYDMIERSANPEHSAVEHIFPRGRSEITLGADLRGVGAAGEALRRAAETGRTTAAGPDWQSEPDTGGDLLVFTPVYSPVPESSLVESSQRRLDGFATGVYNIEGFVSEFLESKDLSGASFRLVDVSEPGPGVELFPETAGDSSTSWPDGQRVSSVIAVAGREWELQFLGPEGFGLGALEREVWLIVMFAGVAITLVAVGSSYSVFASRRAVRSDLELMTTQLSVILDSALEGILLTDADRTVVWANQAFADAFGLGSFQALRGEDLVNLISSPGLAIDGRRRFVARVEAVADDERRTVASEDVIVTAPEPHTLSMTSVPVADESGIYLGRLWVFRDVTTERAAEEAKSEFVSMVSHELRTPLTSVIGFLDLAIDGAGGPVSPKTVGLLGTARSNAERLQRLVNDILETSRLEGGGLALDMGPVSIDALAGELLDEMAAQFRDSELTVELILSESLPQIWADRERMAQVLTNLLSNAARYTPPGGRVIVAGRHDRKSVEIAVTDTGVGIPPEHQGRIFQKFARLDLSRPRPRGSTGLGLSITKSLVESMSGTISLESGVGVGSTFRVNMPAAPHQAS